MNPAPPVTRIVLPWILKLGSSRRIRLAECYSINRFRVNRGADHLAQSFHRELELLVGHLRKYRERNAARHDIFCDGEAAPPASMVGIGRLKRHGTGVVDTRRNPPLGQFVTKLVTVHAPD